MDSGPLQPETPSPARINPIRAGLLCRCPNCGKGRLFSGFLQVVEYEHILHENLFFNDEAINSGLYGSIFFMATGFHGFHVLLGTIFLAVCLLRLLAGQMTCLACSRALGTLSMRNRRS